jgi:hypothetical protein
MSRPQGGQFVPEHTPEGLDAFTRGYFTAMEWLIADEDQEKTIRGIHSVTFKQGKADCDKFQEENEDLLEKYYETYEPSHGYDVGECAGHDFWLTRGHHGAGFWDRELGKLGDKLTEASHKFNDISSSVYRGLIYAE